MRSSVRSRPAPYASGRDFHGSPDLVEPRSTPTFHPDAQPEGVSSPIDRAITAALLVTILALIVGLLIAPREAISSPSHHWPTVTSTWYGPGFYGNRTACGQRYTQQIRGVAHRTLPCGARVTIKRRGVVLHVKVIDRGPYSGATFDLSARTAQDLCRCSRPYTMQHRWTRGWTRGT